MAPNTTRLALAPLIGTGAGSPRSAQPARSGGNSRRSVSSSASTAVRAGKPHSRVGGPDARPPGEVFAQQRGGPLRRPVAEAVGRLRQGDAEQLAQVGRP